MSNMPVKLGLLFLLITGAIVMAAESQKSIPPCTFAISGVEKRYSYFADFVILVTNKSGESVSVRHFEGTPFDIIFNSSGAKFVLRHKADEYAVEHGASRLPTITIIPPFGVASVVVDLKGDYIAVRGGRPILFRDFAVGKQGSITVNPSNQAFFAEDTTHRLIQWDGKGIVVP